MKIRLGFVSNSSSSSYLVRITNMSNSPTDTVDLLKRNIDTLMEEVTCFCPGEEDYIEWAEGYVEDAKEGLTKYEDNMLLPDEIRYYIIKPESVDFITRNLSEDVDVSDIQSLNSNEEMSISVIDDDDD